MGAVSTAEGGSVNTLRSFCLQQLKKILADWWTKRTRHS